MEQQIRFCTTSDGVRIAYATVGDGAAVGLRVRLARAPRTGMGNSDSAGISGGSFRRPHFDSVRYARVRAVGSRTFLTFLWKCWSKTSKPSPATWPCSILPSLPWAGWRAPLLLVTLRPIAKRVSHLVLNSSFLRGSERTTPERQRAMIEYTAAFGDPSWGATVLEGDPLHDFRQLQRSASSSQTEAALLRAMYSADVSHLVGRLTMPALVLHARGDPETPFAQGRELAIQLPNAKFVSYEGCTAGPLAVADILISEIRRFLQMAAEVGKTRSAACRLYGNRGSATGGS